MNAKGLESLCLLACLATAWPLAAGAEVDGEHVLRAASGYKAEREPNTLREVGALEERRITPDEQMVSSKMFSYTASTSASTTFVSDHWIYDAGVEMFFDADEDGYYRYLRVSFDVDSYFDQAWVYAVLYLSPDGEVWEILHETDDFRVDGATSADAYEVETELVSGYPAGDYDLLIEIYDADTGVFHDELGPAETSAFALLPLEDREHDTPAPVIIVEEHGGGGALSLPSLLLLCAAAAITGTRRRRRALEPERAA